MDSNLIFDISIIFGLWFAIVLIRGIAFDSRGSWIPWWKRPVMFLTIWIVNILLGVISIVCLEVVEYSDRLSHGLLIGLPCIFIFVMCAIVAVGSIGMGMVIPFVDEMEID